MRVTLVHNPAAGDEGESPSALAEALRARGADLVVADFDGEDWLEILTEPSDLVVVAGGDGTVREVFKRLAGDARPAAVVPAGSANNIARTLGIEPSDDPSDLVRALEEATGRPFDLGAFAGTPFVESAGGGIFADVLAAATRRHEPSGDEKVEHGLRLLAETIAEAEAAPWGVVVDGRDVGGELLGVEVMNIREIGPNLPLAPRADPGDGLLDVALVDERGREALRLHIAARLADEAAEPLLIDTERGREVEVVPPARARLHVDDQLLRESPQRASAVVGGRLMVLGRR